MGGFFKVYRDIFQHEIFKYELDFRLFMLILGNAVFVKEGIEHRGIHLQQGQWVRSYRMLMKDLEYKENRGYRQYGIATIKRAISRLIKNGLVTVSETESGTLFTVVNYAKYQGFTDEEEEMRNASRNNIETTSEQHRNKNKNVKNGEKEKKKNNYRRKYDDDSPYMKMAVYLKERILSWKPNAKIPKDLNSWADKFRKIHEIDNRSKQDIKEVIDWATSNSFWQAHILSPKKLREKFDTLQGQMNNERTKWNRMKKEKGRNHETKDKLPTVLQPEFQQQHQNELSPEESEARINALRERINGTMRRLNERMPKVGEH